MALDGGKIVSYLELDTSGYESSLKSVMRQLKDAGNQGLTASKRLSSLGGALGTAGSALNRGVTVPLLAAGTAAATAAISFESAFAGVRKTVNATEAEYASLAQGLKDMSGEIPASANELAGLMEIAGQLGVDQGNLLDFTRTIANLGVTTNLSGEAAASMLAQYANVMQMPLDQIGNLGSVIVALGNSCATTESDIAEMAQRLAGTGNLLGLTNAQVMGLSATMSSLGINAEAGGSAMSRTMQTMGSAVLGGGKELESFAHVAGMSAADFAAAWQRDAIGALDSFVAGIGRINQSGGDAVGVLESLGLSDLRIVDTVLRLSGAEGALTANVAIANQAWTENSALQNEANQRYATTESQLQLAKNAVVNMASSLGSALLPMLSEGANTVASLADGFAALDTSTQKTIVTVAGIAAAAGPVLSILGKTMTLLSGPAGWVALLGAAGVAGAVAISRMRQAAIQADLDRRFGDVTLSASELDQAMVQMTGRSTAYTEAWTMAGEETSAAVEAMKASAQSLDTLLVKASLGFDVAPEDMRTAAQQLATDARTAIEAQRIKANLAIDTLFDPGDWRGTLLAGQIGGHFAVLQSEAESLGKQLAEAVEQGMADGFLDENEQATIDALRTQLMNILQQVADVESGSQLYRWRNQVGAAGLSAQSIMDLLESSNVIYQGGLTEKQEARDYLKTLLSQQAASEGWSQAKYDAEAALIDRQYETSAQAWAAEIAQAQWEAIGASVKNAYGAEFERAGTFMEQAKEQARDAADNWMRDYSGMTPEDEGYAEAWAAMYKDQLHTAFAGGWIDVIDPQAQASLQELYTAMMPTHETLRQLAQSMGSEFPAELQAALDDMNILEMLVSTPGDAWAEFVQNIDTSPVREAGAQAGSEAAAGMEEGSAEAGQIGEQAGQGFSQGVSSQSGAAYSAGAALAKASMGGLRNTLQVRSPSRVAWAVGGYFVSGYAGSILAGRDTVWSAGTALGKASVSALATAIDAHSPANETIKQGINFVKGFANGIVSLGKATVGLTTEQGRSYVAGFAKGVGDRLGQTTVGKAVSAVASKAGSVFSSALDEVKKQQEASAASSSAARARAAAAAEAARQKAVLDGIKQTAAATLAADNAAYAQRMNLLSSQQQSLMDFAGSHAIWYQDDKGETETQAVKDRYDALIAQEKARYEKQVATLQTDAQKKAAEQAYKDRVELLKKQRDEEAEAVRKQYELQKNMAADWLSYQKSLLSAELSAKRAAYAEEDYQDELADLQKKLRQSKSAREKRELQEQIDKMIRDHALEQEEAALQETLAGYDALIEAVNAGLIGMGDLTGNAAFGDLSFGTAGLGALDTITSAQIAAVLGSLNQNALSGGTSATVSSAQMAAALQSASASGTVAAVVKQEGNHYTIDLRGATVRDDSDIDRIVAELDRRLREAGR